MWKVGILHPVVNFNQLQPSRLCFDVECGQVIFSRAVSSLNMSENMHHLPVIFQQTGTCFYGLRTKLRVPTNQTNMDQYGPGVHHLMFKFF